MNNIAIIKYQYSVVVKSLEKGLIDRNTNNYIYYFALGQEQRLVERSEYLQAWHEYWHDIDNGFCYVNLFF